jgi:mannose-6-phosphate isomerase-like protein (cupin superfamily)
MKRSAVQSAKRTLESSPAIYRWGRCEGLQYSPRSGRLKVMEPSGSLPWLIKLVLVSALIVAASASVFAQRKPSEATRPFVVLSAQSLDDLKQKLQPDNKTAELIDSSGMQLRVAVQHEKNRADAGAELHDASDDVYYVLEGSALLTLGGRLDAPKEADPGEWRSPKIVDGKTFEIKKGDLVIVPRGTPHQRSTANKDFTMILIKIYQEPLKKKA